MNAKNWTNHILWQADNSSTEHILNYKDKLHEYEKISKIMICGSTWNKL